MTELPPPLVPADVDLRDLDGFMLNVERLLASELWALADGRSFKAAVALWCRAWKQVPAATLPDDDAVLASFAGMTPAQFRRDRALVMRGFVLCSDGRWHHRTLAEDAARAWQAKRRRSAERTADAERLRKYRERRRTGGNDGDETPGETRFTAPDETRTTGVRQGQGQGQGQIDIPEPSPPSLPVVGRPCADAPDAASRPPTNPGAGEDLLEIPEALDRRRATRLPDDWPLTDELLAEAQRARLAAALPPIEVAVEHAKFCDYWRSKAGRDAAKRDWTATWRNWCRNARAPAAAAGADAHRLARAEAEVRAKLAGMGMA